MGIAHSYLNSSCDLLETAVKLELYKSNKSKLSSQSLLNLTIN